MAQREKVYLMTRLSLIESQYGKQIRKAEDHSRIDLITNPVWRWGFLVTVLFFLIAGILAALNIDMVLHAVASDQTKNLIMVVLIAWLSVLAICIVITTVRSVSKWRRIDALREQYHRMLGQLERINAMDNGRRRKPSAYGEENWDESLAPGRERRGRRPSDEELDYDRMQVLEFEDDDYCYYVEAVPKRGGRRR